MTEEVIGRIESNFSRRTPIDDRNTREGLRGTSVTCPAVDEALIAAYVRSYVRAGFLHAPASRRGTNHEL